jgi:hypothetical protein
MLSYPSLGLTIPGSPQEDFINPVRIYGEDISRSIFQGVSQARYLGFIQKLTENGSRSTSQGNPPYFSSANIYARNWISEQLQILSNDRIEVEILGYHKSIVGKLPGYLPDGAPVLMVGGHYDSVPGAPGANDDGTGVAGALELARVMSRYEWPLDIYFCAWNSEEIGLIGSAEVANIFELRGIDILTYWNIDMLLVEDENAPVDERVLMVHNDHTMKFAQVSRAMSKNFGMNLVRPLMNDQFSGWSRSDHASFLSEGYENVLFAFESGFDSDTAYHSSEDTWDNPHYNYTVARDAVASIGASMAYTMARAHEQQHIQQYYGYVRPSTQLSYYLPISTTTRLILNGGWSGVGLKMKLYSPGKEELFAFTSIQASAQDELIANVSLNSIGLHELVIHGNQSSDVSFNLNVMYDDDLDNDGIRDSTQFWLDNELFNVDQDGDGLSDALEIIIGTSSNSKDTDMDGMPDLWEYEEGLNPTLPNALRDPDGDSLLNIQEYGNGTAPRKADSDSDGIPDGWEVVNGTDALTNDAKLDPDGDGVPNIYEYGNRTNPHNIDSDSDTMWDLWEIMNGLDPTKDDAHLDYDEDGLTNVREFLAGTNPFSSDSDQDGMPDNWELLHSLNPTEDDATEDPDGDGASNLEEFMNGGDPRFPYTTLPVILIAVGIPLILVAVWFARRWRIKRQ